MDVAERAHPRPELPPGAVALGRGAGQLRQLADDDVDRRPGEEAGDDRLREELGDPAQLQSREQQEQHARQQRDRGHELRRLIASEPGHEHRAPGDRRERGARAGRDLPRRAEQRVDERSRRRRVEAVLQRHAGDAGVAEVLRHDQRRHGDPCGDVASQPATLVARQPVDDRKQAAHDGHPRMTGNPSLERSSPDSRCPPFGGLTWMTGYAG